MIGAPWPITTNRQKKSRCQLKLSCTHVGELFFFFLSFWENQLSLKKMKEYNTMAQKEPVHKNTLITKGFRN